MASGQRPTDRLSAIALARTEMRKSFYKLLEASKDFLAITEDIRLSTSDHAQFRTAKKSNPHRADALDSWKYHSDNIQTMAAFIQTELALADRRSHTPMEEPDGR